MAETFFGPWVIVLDYTDTDERFTISGSDNADGSYPVGEGDLLEIEVAGEDWRIQIERHPFPGTGNWKIRRTTQFVAGKGPGKGLVVKLDAERRTLVEDGGVFFPGVKRMKLTCTSTDPATNPIPTPNPYDFTIPEHG
jgi:hypothetical protein